MVQTKSGSVIEGRSGEAEAETGTVHALPYHDGLALIAAERRGLHAVRTHLRAMLELATSASWPATGETARAELQARMRGLDGELRDLCGVTRFRGLRLLDDECPMVGIQDGPDGGEFLVLGLPDVRPEVLGVHGLDLGSAASARAARIVLWNALATVELAEAVVVQDLHELLGAPRVRS